jgi:hypothetical protein
MRAQREMLKRFVDIRNDRRRRRNGMRHILIANMNWERCTAPVRNPCSAKPVYFCHILLEERFGEIVAEAAVLRVLCGGCGFCEAQDRVTNVLLDFHTGPDLMKKCLAMRRSIIHQHQQP